MILLCTVRKSIVEIMTILTARSLLRFKIGVNLTSVFLTIIAVQLRYTTVYILLRFIRIHFQNHYNVVIVGRKILIMTHTRYTDRKTLNKSF